MWAFSFNIDMPMVFSRFLITNLIIEVHKLVNHKWLIGSATSKVGWTHESGAKGVHQIRILHSEKRRYGSGGGDQERARRHHNESWEIARREKKTRCTRKSAIRELRVERFPSFPKSASQVVHRYKNVRLRAQEISFVHQSYLQERRSLGNFKTSIELLNNIGFDDPKRKLTIYHVWNTADIPHKRSSLTISKRHD